MLSLLVQRRSLLILQDDMYKFYLHGIHWVCESTWWISHQRGLRWATSCPAAPESPWPFAMFPKSSGPICCLARSDTFTDLVELWTRQTSYTCLHPQCTVWKCNIQVSTIYYCMCRALVSVRVFYYRYLTWWHVCSSLLNICLLKAEKSTGLSKLVQTYLHW